MADPQDVGQAQGKRGIGASFLPQAAHDRRKSPSPGEKPFAKARITRVWQQRLGDLTEAEAKAEGSESVKDFLRIFGKINEKKIKGDIKDVQVYAVEFSVVEKLV